MSNNTKIEWSDATWNPVTGCDEVSPGCDRCYAKTFAERWRGIPGHHFENGFDVTLRPDKLDLPLRWRKPRKVFVNSMSDLFHDKVPAEYIAKVFAVMSQAPQHTFQILTKRHGRMRSLLNSDHFQGDAHSRAIDLVQNRTVEHAFTWPLPNVWIGVSAEDQSRAELRVKALLETPAVIRWVSAEPLLGPIDFRNLKASNGALIDALGGDVKTSDGREVYSCTPAVLDWIVVGGESGHGARPMHPDWARGLRDQCQTAGVPYLFKQWGEWGPAPWAVRIPNAADLSKDELAAAKADAEVRGATHLIQPWGHIYEPDHKAWSLERDADGDYPGAIRRWGKKAAGRDLDGRTWDEYPKEVAV